MLKKNFCGRAAGLFECQAAGTPGVPAMHQSPSGVNVVPGNQQSGSRIAIDVIGPALVPHYMISVGNSSFLLPHAAYWGGRANKLGLGRY
jgi:hypothetical protein